MASLLLALLVQQERVTPLLSVWQTFLVFLDFLGTLGAVHSSPGKQDWEHGALHFHSEAAAAPVAFDAECVCVMDDSFGYCVSYRLEREVMREVGEKARRDLARIRGVYDCMVQHARVERAAVRPDAEVNTGIAGEA